MRVSRGHNPKTENPQKMDATYKQIFGTVRGEAAKRLPAYLYRAEIPVDNLYPKLTDPNRYYRMHEYPRDNAFYFDDVKTVDLCDYRIDIGETQSDGSNLIEVWALPGEYTTARGPRLVFRTRAFHVAPLRYLDGLIDHTLKLAFKSPRRR